MAAREGQSLPSPERPTPSPFPEFDAWILRAFGQLSTCRDFGMGIGPIPWTAMVAYADRERMTPSTAEVFIACVTAMDRAFLADEQAKVDAAKKQR